MAKNRSKKKRNDEAPMDTNSDQTFRDAPRPQAMDMSESATPYRPVNTSSRNKKKGGVPMKRSKNVRRMKAIAKAISQNEKSAERVSKSDSKSLRTQSAKKLYD